MSSHPPQAAQRRTLPDFAFGPRADMQTADRMRVAHARWFFPINGKSSAGPQRAVQVERSADECKVRESLREVSQGLATMTGLFRIEAAPMLIAKTIGCIAAAKLAALGEL